MKWLLSGRLLLLVTTGVVLFVPSANGASKKARKQNQLGMAAHKKGDYAQALIHFDRSYAIDPTYHIALFNSACASAKDGDETTAIQKIEQYLSVRPDNVAKVLHDPDLVSIRQNAAWLSRLRARVRPAGKTVRPIVFERRQQGSDLYLASEDGLDVKPLAIDPNIREHTASFADGGKTVVYLASRKPTGYDIYHDFSQNGRQILHEPDDELRAYALAQKKERVLATRVHHYQLSPDGSRVLFVDRPSPARKKDGYLRIREISLAEGSKAVTLAQIDVIAAVWCMVERDDGMVLIEGIPHHGWLTGLRLRVSRYVNGKQTVLIPKTKGHHRELKIFDFPACVANDDKTVVHLGNAKVVLGDTPRIERLDNLVFGRGAYTERRKGERAGISGGKAPQFFITVDGEIVRDDEDYEHARFPDPWKVSSLSSILGTGMGPDFYYRTQLRRISWDGKQIVTLTQPKTHLEYGPCVSAQNDRLAFTRLLGRSGMPWIFVSDLDGNNARPVVQGQYPVWGPIPFDFEKY